MDSEPPVTLLLFPPAANTKQEEKDSVGEKSSISLDLSLSCGDSISTSTYKGKELNKSCEDGESSTKSSEPQRKEKESQGLALELSDLSLESSLSWGYYSYNFMSNANSDNGSSNEGNQKRSEIVECSHQQESEIGNPSLELTLGFNDSTTCTSKKRENPSSSARRVSSCKNKRAKLVDREEARMLILTELRLGPWTIKKKLTKSDVSRNLCRLMLAAECLESHVFPLWDDDQIAKIKQGLTVSVGDVNTQTEHEMVFKRWNERANVFTTNWVPSFVKRRELKQDDEIGLYWDTCNSRFHFTVLKRADQA